MKIKTVPFYFRVIDYFMIPIMWVVCRFNFELPQETHPWHMRSFYKIDVPKNKSVVVYGDDESKHDIGGRLKLFHMPIFGGWRNYIILEAKDYGKYWNVGWIVKFNDSRKTIYQVQALRIKEPKIKLLKGINDSKKTFFAVGENGEFASLSLVDKGIIGDGKNKKVRLF